VNHVHPVTVIEPKTKIEPNNPSRIIRKACANNQATRPRVRRKNKKNTKVGLGKSLHGEHPGGGLAYAYLSRVP